MPVVLEVVQNRVVNLTEAHLYPSEQLVRPRKEQYQSLDMWVISVGLLDATASHRAVKVHLLFGHLLLTSLPQWQSTPYTPFAPWGYLLSILLGC